MINIEAVTKEQLAYFAGLFDGEGCLIVGKYIVKSQRNLAYRGFMAVTNTHIPTLLHIKSLFGGKIVVQGIERKCYSLAFSANEIRRVLPELLPYLIVKREQAEVILEFFEKQSSHSFGLLSQSTLDFYEECYQKMKKLKKIRFDFKNELRILGVKKCLQCGNDFTFNSKNPNRKYCSEHCSKKRRWTYYNRMKSERLRELKLNLN